MLLRYFFGVFFVPLIEITGTGGKKQNKTKPKTFQPCNTKSFSLEKLTDTELRIGYAISKLLLTAILFISQLKYPSSPFA